MPQLSMNDQIARLVATTLPRYMKEPQENVIRNQKLLAMLQKKGMMEFNVSGRYLEWLVEYKYGRTRTRSPGDTITFDNVDRYKNVSVPWAQYIQTDNYTREEADRNKGREAIISYYAKIPEKLSKGLERDIGYELYTDGTLASSVNKLYGMETLFGNTGSAIATTPVMNPSGNYGGLSKALGNYGGTANSSQPWPIGRVAEDYDFFTPLILDATSTLVKTASNYAWTNATNGWAYRCEEILSFAITHSQRNVNGQDAMMSMFLMDANYYNSLKNVMRAKEKVEINRGENAQGLTGLGFRDVINFDGVDCTYEYGLPASAVYGFNIAQMGLKCETGQLFEMEGPEWDPHHKAWLCDASFRGQLYFNPRHQVKIAEYATNGA